MDDRKPTPNLDREQHQIDVARREDALVAEVNQKLPDFAGYCVGDAPMILMHQDAFAADYQDDELRLLGMAIKYAGLNGKEVRIIGSNQETLHRNS